MSGHSDGPHRFRALVALAAVAILVAAVALLVRTPRAAQPRHAATVDAPPPRHTATTHASPAHIVVRIRNYDFRPKALTVKVGTRVTWTNADSAAHTATADHGAFESGTINPHASRTVALTRPGTYTYHCAFHAFMTARVTVTR